MAPSMSLDPTAIDIEFDPERQWMQGKAIHGNMPFSAPFISKIADNLYMGGCRRGLLLPYHIRHVISLYPWESYRLHASVDTFHETLMYDAAAKPDTDEVHSLAILVNECRESGPTLVHCQAGLNRSGLISAIALVLDGMAPADAIALLREKRSPAVLCNPTFEQFVLEFTP